MSDRAGGAEPGILARDREEVTHKHRIFPPFRQRCGMCVGVFYVLLLQVLVPEGWMVVGIYIYTIYVWYGLGAYLGMGTFPIWLCAIGHGAEW